MRVADLRPLAALRRAERRPARRAAGRRHRGRRRARRRAVPRGRARRLLVGARRRRARAGHGSRPRGDGASARMDVPGRWAGGFRAWDDQGVYLATGRGVVAGPDAPGAGRRCCATLSDAWFPFGGHLIEGLYHTARTIESTARQRESLRHPRHAGRRARPRDQQPGRGRDPGRRRAEAPPATRCCPRSAGSPTTRSPPPSSPRSTRCASRSGPVDAVPDPLALADREEALSAWLSRHGVPDEWLLAPPLAAAGVDVAWCDRVAAVLDGRRLRAGAASGSPARSRPRPCSPRCKESTRRISELVAAVRSYSQMDRASRAADRRHRRHREHAGDARPQAPRPASPSCATTATTCRRSTRTPASSTRCGPTSIDNAVDAMDGAGHAADHAPASTATASSSRSPTPARACPRRWRPARSRRSTRPRTSARAPASASTSPAASSSSGTTATISHRLAARRHRAAGQASCGDASGLTPRPPDSP